MKTTVEISTPLLRRAKRFAAKHNTTLRNLMEEGLAASLKSREESESSVVYEPLIFTAGNGLSPEFAHSGWDNIRDALYEGRGT
jgi:hypothetical protein